MTLSKRFWCGFLACCLVASMRGAEDTQLAAEEIQRAALEYNRRLEVAGTQMSELRARILAERGPIAESTLAQERVVHQLQAETELLETTAARAGSERRVLEGELDAAVKNLAFVTMQARDGLAGARDLLPTGAGQLYDERLEGLMKTLERANPVDAGPAMATADSLLEQVRTAMGGHAARGRVIAHDGNQVVAGQFVFFGPEVFFKATAGTPFGVVRSHEGAPLPVVYPIQSWDPVAASAFFDGDEGVIPADGSGGKALRFQEAKGDFWTHLRKGGVIGYVILALGGAGLLIAVLKLIDLRSLALDPPAVVQRAFDTLAAHGAAGAEKVIRPMRRSLRELFEAGLRHWGQSRESMEEQLFAVILQQRMRHERRLPLLAVIVTAAPLLGLLGTVTGMVRTFTLITVYGTGNAARLSSGISEALVTTQLGLTVAIPILILHGYLAHRMRRNLAQLERYAHALVATADEGREGAAALEVRAP